MRSNKYIYWTFKKILPINFCDDVIKFARSLEKTKKEKGQTFGSIEDHTVFKKRNNKKLNKQRDSSIIWLDDLWIHKELNDVANVANKEANWHLQWHTGEFIQFTEYGINQHYDWHQDRLVEPRNVGGRLDNTNRKLSLTVSLSDPKDYEGGILEFCTIEHGKLKIYKCTDILEKGSVCVFPSDIWHRVTPVTKGKRLSLVKWLSGNPLQ